MRMIFGVVFTGLVVAGAAQTVPIPQPTPPTAQVPTVTPPTVQVPQPPVPTPQVPTATVPTIPAPQSPLPMGQVPTSAQAGQEFTGTWSASGQRQSLLTELTRQATTVQLSGAVAITTGTGLARGFRGEAIGFDDGGGLAAGSVVWTDDRGDRIFSVLQGDAFAAAGRQMRGKITGGTGRYAGFAGEYAFTWQHVITTEGSSVNGRAIDLRGRVQLGSSSR